MQLRPAAWALVGSILRRRSYSKLYLMSSNKIGKVERTIRVTVLVAEFKRSCERSLEKARDLVVEHTCSLECSLWETLHPDCSSFVQGAWYVSEIEETRDLVAEHKRSLECSLWEVLRSWCRSFVEVSFTLTDA